MQYRILLVEADPTISKHLLALLRQRGYQCAAVTTLSAALAAMRDALYDAIIVDLDLAGGEPRACASELRSAGAASRLIGLDSRGEPPEDDRLQESFDTVIPKPFFVEPLFAALPTTSYDDVEAAEG